MEVIIIIIIIIRGKAKCKQFFHKQPSAHQQVSHQFGVWGQVGGEVCIQGHRGIPKIRGLFNFQYVRIFVRSGFICFNVKWMPHDELMSNNYIYTFLLFFFNFGFHESEDSLLKKHTCFWKKHWNFFSNFSLKNSENSSPKKSPCLYY